jgi:DedD protein
MDQGLKERLVGAAVLVAIAVWLIPWVLDGPENPVETGPASLQLPASQEPVPMRTQTLKLGEPPAAAQPTEAAAEKTELPAAQAETVVAAATPEPPKPGPAVPTTAPATTPPSAATSTAPKPDSGETKRKPPTATPAPAAAAGPSAAKGDWTVQLGVFGDESNARRLADRASTFGYKVNVASYKANGKTMYRVRLGTYSSKGQAEATASALGAHGITAKAVAAD